MVQMVETLRVNALISVYRRFGDLFGMTSRSVYPRSLYRI